MTRISTYAANQSALMDLMKAQKQMFEAQQQMTTGKLVQDLKGVGYQAEMLSSARAAKTQAESYEEAATRTEARLSAQDTALEHIAAATDSLRLAITTKEGDYIMQQTREAFHEVVNALNTQHAGTYVFAGTRSNVKPADVSDISDLIPMGTADEAFQNNQRKPQVQLDQGYNVEVGMLADDIGGEVMASFKRIAEFDAGANGPFTSPTTAAQEAFLQTEIQNVIAALDNLHMKVGENGAKQAHVENLKTNHVERQDFIKMTISDVEDADIAEAITRFEQAQTAVQVSAATFSSLNQVSLLNYLR